MRIRVVSDGTYYGTKVFETPNRESSLFDVDTGERVYLEPYPADECPPDVVVDRLMEFPDEFHLVPEYPENIQKLLELMNLGKEEEEMLRAIVDELTHTTLGRNSPW